VAKRARVVEHPVRRRVRWALAIAAIVVEIAAFAAWRFSLRRRVQRQLASA
jgi:hypothetical protein